MSTPDPANDPQAALSDLQASAQGTADAIDQAFAKASESLARSLARAVSDGKISLAELARAAIQAVDALPGSSGSGGGLGEALAALLSQAFGGARADGGPVTAGKADLVGERGPELFRPLGGGTVEPLGAPSLTENITVPGADGPSLVRSETQIAQALARPVSLGAR